MHGESHAQPLTPAAPPHLPSPGARLWGNHDFTIFWLGQTISSFGDAFSLVALPLLVLQATGSVVQMGLVTGTNGVMRLVATLFAGALVDRSDRRRLMIVVNVLNMLLYASLPIGWWLVGPHLWQIYIVVGLAGLLTMTFQVAAVAALANLIERDQLTVANSRIQGLFALAYIIGPILAGITAEQLGAATAIGVDAVSFGVAALAIVTIRFRHTAIALSPASTSSHRGAELLAGVRFLLHQPVLRAIVLLDIVFALSIGGAMDLFIFHLKHDLRLTGDGVGLVLGAASVGGILASLGAPAIRRRCGFGTTLLGGLAIDGLALVMIGFAPTALITAFAGMLFTFGDTILTITSMSIRQELTPDHLMGRVGAAFQMVFTAPGPIGAALGTALAARTGAASTMALIGAISVLLAIIGSLTPANARHPENQSRRYLSSVGVEETRITPLPSAPPISVTIEDIHDHA